MKGEAMKGEAMNDEAVEVDSGPSGDLVPPPTHSSMPR